MTLTRENCTFASRLSLIARDDRGSSITTRHDILARKALEKSYITLVKYNTRAKQLASYEELLARRWVIHASVLHASVKFKSSGTVALATASSGIAATLLTGGRTLHSTFKIPLDLYAMDIPICSIKKGTALSRVIQEGKATVVDEAPMTNKLAFEALDRTLRDLTGKDQLMEGMCMLLCGDFRQILPVIQGGTRGNIVDSCLKKSFLWEHVVVKHLDTNMRVHLHGDEAAGEFAGQLLAIGDGKYPIDTSPDIIQLPESIGTFVCNIEELVSKVYPDLLSNFRNMAWLSERCILAPLNESTRAINTALVAQLPGESVEYRSLDSVLDESQAVHFSYRISELSGDLGISFTSAVIKGFCPNNHFTIFRSP